ncbi:AI-2E family transporter [Segetibacter sp. 3557_3]|uniref:AI-2E family transporter n=1 Tax=Segetibacter sp. 3557_3 TaxID=2547429 RepID=UPI001058C7B0|nr:AI-2E family transporter [Segetibacter sp. 3557_3]TDH27376.1 AI-2E family transporter [Segetibacter sp. 3557_3]
MQATPSEGLYKALIKAITFAASIIIFLWLLFKITSVIMLLLFAVVLALIINAPITWLEKKGMKRIWACVIVFGSMVLTIVALCWLIIPIISNQVSILISNIPDYASRLSFKFSEWFKNYPNLNKGLQKGSIDVLQFVPSLQNTIINIGNYSLSLISSLLIFILMMSMIAYMVVQPRPLVELYLSFFSLSNRDKAANALSKCSIMLVGWFNSNLIAGLINAVSITVFLNIMDVPAALVWGVLAFFSGLVPKLGFYIMAVPPLLVALSVSPMTALWVAIFFLALDEIMGDFIMPKVRSNMMNIHPASIIILLFAMGAAFGVFGIIMATPIAAIIKAYYEEFYLSKAKNDDHMEQRIDHILYREVTPANDPLP